MKKSCGDTPSATLNNLMMEGKNCTTEFAFCGGTTNMMYVPHYSLTVKVWSQLHKQVWHSFESFILQLKIFTNFKLQFSIPNQMLK